MNEITRIHIAKTAYDIEVAAKKQLEKYIKSLEAYTQDSDVLMDVEVRMTELLAERGVKAGGVIGSDDVAAVRKQLGEPYEFAGEEGDIAVGPVGESSNKRLYRSTDNAMLGGVLSGIAAYFNVNPLWTRLIFVLLLFISFGFASVLYILFWILTPPARTATEKLQLVGKDVTVESIRELNADEEAGQPNRVAPILKQILSVGFGTLSLMGAVSVFIATVWIVIGALTSNSRFMDVTNGFTGLGNEGIWLVWLMFWIVVFGMLLLTALFGLIAYAFYAKKLTKRMLISGIVIIVLGIASVATVVGVGSTQSLRVANESRALVRDTKANLPKTFSDVHSVTLNVVNEKSGDAKQQNLFDVYGAIEYVVDSGTPRYELSALPSAKPVVTINGTDATISLVVPESYRNSFVRPTLTIYGPALNTVTAKNAEISYTALTQDTLSVVADKDANVTISGTFATVNVQGEGSVDLGASATQALTVHASQNMTVTAGTVRQLSVTQPDVCPSDTYHDNTTVTVSGVTSGTMSYNGTTMPVQTHRTSCASVVIEPANE